MKKVTPISFSFDYQGGDESEERCSRAYSRIFRAAWKKLIDTDSTQKYTDEKYGPTTEDVSHH